MTSKRIVIGGIVVAVYVLAAVVAPTAFVFLCLAAFWAGLWFGARWAVARWNERLYLQRAQFVSDIRRVDYFRHVSNEELESWVLTVLALRGWVLLGDPIGERSFDQGYAWMNGKKAILFIQTDRPLNQADLVSIYSSKNKVQADSAIIISPFADDPGGDHPGLDVLAGKKLLSWMSVLNRIEPVNVGSESAGTCGCGSPREECVSRAGEPLWICSRHPDCQQVTRPGFSTSSK